MAKTVDPKAIRGLAHPLRLGLIEVLGVIGPATAARCGRVLGVGQASCSFHLRQLAKYGFVEDAGPGEDRRERRWRVTDRRLSISADGDSVVTRELSQVAVQREADRILEYFDRRESEPEQWRDGSGGIMTTLPLTAQEAVQLKQAWKDLLAPYEARAAADDFQATSEQRHVRLFWAATPLATDQTPGAQDDGAHD